MTSGYSELVIAAAGSSTRLGGKFGAKSLIPVKNVPLIDRILGAFPPSMVPHATIVTSPADAAQWESWRRPRLVERVEDSTADGSRSVCTSVLAGLKSIQARIGDGPHPAVVWVVWGDMVGLDTELTKTADYTARQAQLVHASLGYTGVVLPVTIVPKPYVNIVMTSRHILRGVDLSRCGDTMPEHGLVDVGMFGFPMHTAEALGHLVGRLEDFILEAPQASQEWWPFLVWLNPSILLLPVLPRYTATVNTPDDLMRAEGLAL